MKDNYCLLLGKGLNSKENYAIEYAITVDTYQHLYYKHISSRTTHILPDFTVSPSFKSLLISISHFIYLYLPRCVCLFYLSHCLHVYIIFSTCFTYRVILFFFIYLIISTSFISHYLYIFYLAHSPSLLSLFLLRYISSYSALRLISCPIDFISINLVVKEKDQISYDVFLLYSSTDR
jgi:hypothetical protein